MTLSTSSRRFQPRLWTTVAALPALLILVGLGLWQLDRLAWKSDLLATIEQRASAPAVPLPASIDDPAAWNYRRVHVSGILEPEHAMRLVGRVHDGRAGDQVVVPLERTGGEGSGQIVLVDRGWVPVGWQSEAGPEDVVVTGLLHVPSPAGWLQPANEPAANVWFSIDLAQMAEVVGASDLFPMVLYEDPGSVDALPIGGQLRITLANDHLNYALTWFSLAIVLLVIYVLFHLRRPEDRG